MLPAQPGPMAGPPAKAAGPVLPAGQERAGAGRVLPQHRLVAAGGEEPQHPWVQAQGLAPASCTVLDGSSEWAVLSPQPHTGCKERSVLSPAPGGCSEFCVLSTRSPSSHFPPGHVQPVFPAPQLKETCPQPSPPRGPLSSLGMAGRVVRRAEGVLQGDPPFQVPQVGQPSPVLTRPGG